MKAIEKITKLAGELDKSGLNRASSVLDKIAGRVLKIVEAQCVGVQGWAIRNSRCWSNCYRQKRASKPDTPVQEIWSECQSEYVDYVNDGTDSWGKYAGDDQKLQRLQKFASVRPKLYKDVMARERDYFHKASAKKMNNGMRPEDAITQTLKESINKYKIALYQEADNLLTIADKVKGKNDKLARRLAQCAKEVVHFAYVSYGQEK